MSKNKYQLYIDNRLTSAFDSFDEASEMVFSEIKENLKLRIECDSAPAKSKIWIYDYDISAWVQQL